MDPVRLDIRSPTRCRRKARTLAGETLRRRQPLTYTDSLRRAQRRARLRGMAVVVAALAVAAAIALAIAILVS